MGKGDKPRKTQVSRKQFEDNWDRIFCVSPNGETETQHTKRKCAYCGKETENKHYCSRVCHRKAKRMIGELTSRVKQ